MGMFKVNSISLNSEESNFGNWVYDIKCTTNNTKQGSVEDKEALKNAIEAIEEQYKYIYCGRGNGKTSMSYNYITTNIFDYETGRVKSWRNEYEKERDKFDIKDVIFNDPATIVIWADGTKTVVKAENEPFDPEKGLAMAISKRALGNKYDYYDTFKKYVGRYEKKQSKKR